MASTGGYENIIIPSFFGSPGAAMEKAIDRKRDDYQFEQQLNERREERSYAKQQNNRLYNLREIDSDTDFQKYKTGQQAIDGYTMGELKKIKDNALQQYINLDPAEMEYRLTQDMNDLAGWHQSIKDDYDKMQKGLTQFAKDNPNVDVNKAYDFSMNELGKKYMAGNQNGYERVPAERIQHSVDPLSVLNDPSVLGYITNDVKPFQDYIQGLKLQSVGGSEYKSKKGYAKGFKYSGGVSPISEMTFDEDGRPSGTKVKSETLDIGGGRKLEMLPEDEFKNIMNIPAARNSLLKMWNDEKMSKGIGKLDAPTEERLFRDYARKQYEKYDASYIKEDEKDIVPRPPQININVGKEAVNDVYQTIESTVDQFQGKGYHTRINSLNADAQTVIADFVNKATGGTKLNYSNMFLYKSPDGSIGVYKKRKDGELDHAEKYLITTLPKVGTNLKVQPGAPEKRAVIAEGNETTPQPQKQETLAERMRKLKGK